MDTQIALDSVIRLNKILANLAIALFNSLNAHWKITGVAFASNHEFFKMLYENTFTRMDDIAERIRALNGMPTASLSRYLALATLHEDDTPEADTLHLNRFATLHQNWEEIVTQLHTTLAETPAQDVGTKNLLEGIVADMEKEAWMIKSHL